MKIKFPDGSVREFESGVNAFDIAGAISPSLKKNTIAAKVNGELYDASRKIEDDSTIELITKDSKEGFDVLNHSTAHLLAHAVKNLYPNATFGIGPSIEEGFYYDIDPGSGLTIGEYDLIEIEKEMHRISSQAVEIERIEVSRDEALVAFRGSRYKTELIKDLPEDEKIIVYRQGDFGDLCRGAHVAKTSEIKYFKLLSIAGAYWRGNSDNPVLQRIYGTSWFSKKELENHLEVLEDRKQRDHRKIGKEQKLFALAPEFGQGLAYWTPRGFKIRKQLEDYVYKLEQKYGYQHISTPIMGSRSLYETSGHWKHYRENMFPIMEREGEEMVLRPMSCPHHMVMYKQELRSFRDLPIRYAESVIMHRYESSGALTGLERVRGMTLTDAHIFCTREQVKEEVKSAYEMIITAINDLNLKIDYVELALRDEDKSKYHDDDDLWNEAEQMLRDILTEMGVEYREMKGEAAFYGPKVDIQIRTVLNHVITASTVQLDFLLAKRFELSYIEAGGEKVTPIVIHRGLISTWERLMSILIEQTKGLFPLWLSPEQIMIIPVSNDVHGKYAKKLREHLIDEDIRVEIDMTEEKLGYKIREAQTNKIPYTLVIGDKEVETMTVTYRKHGSQDQVNISLNEFVQMIKTEIREKK